MQLLVGFSSAKKWHYMTWAVKFVEGTPFSHVYVRVIDGSSDTICNIAPDEDQSIDYNKFIKYNNIIKEFPLSFEDGRIEEIRKRLVPESQIYAFLKIFAIGWARLSNNTNGKFAKFLWNKGRGIICTEFTVGVLKAAGYNIDIDLRRSGPKQLFDILSGTENKKMNNVSSL